MAACGSQPPAGRSGNTGQDSSEPNLNLPVNLNFTSDHSVPEAVPAAVLGSSGRGRPACAASCHSLVVGPARQGWQFGQARQGPARPRLRAWAAGGLRLQVPGTALSLASGTVTGTPRVAAARARAPAGHRDSDRDRDWRALAALRL